MNPFRRLLLLSVLFHCAVLPGYSQQANPYILNGSATQDDCHCYTLTKQQENQAGSVWNKNKISLDSSFDFNFSVFLGCQDAQGADGIVFVLQPVSTSVGGYGQGLGFEGVTPSVGIPIDTWQNLEYNDPAWDHIGIYKNGDLVNGSANMLSSPKPALADYSNIEDCQWHSFRITWDAKAKILSAYIDGNLRARTTTDLIATIFSGKPEVYWGFSGATGGGTNLQRFCTSLSPGFNLPSSQKSCAPATLLFQDSSVSFGTIVQWTWDFGDGTAYAGSHPPAHKYPSAGTYTVKLNIVGNDGCLSDTFKKVLTIGSIPKAAFHSTPPFICAGDTAFLADDSRVQFGTLNEWDWTLNATAPVKQATPELPVVFGLGLQTMALQVKTVEGCVSTPVSQVFDVTEKPVVAINAPDGVCYGDPVHFDAVNNTPAAIVRQFYWIYGDGRLDSTAAATHTYLADGNYTAALYAVNNKGCVSDTVDKNIIVYRTRANAGNDSIVAIGQPVQLRAAGGWSYQWRPAIDLSDAFIANPVATLSGDMTYVLEASSPVGCPSYDTITLKAYRGPELYVPNAFTPNADGRNDRFRAVAPGMAVIRYFRVYNRNGQLLYSSQDTREGWDGNWHGQPQPSGGYVWMIGGTDYLGAGHSAKGTLVLIR